MLQKYFILLFIFQFLIEINCQTFPSIDKERSEHTATLIDKKLYILGGLSTNNVGKDFFYFDFSVPFNTQNLLIKDLSSINTIPSHFGAGSARGGAINDTLFIIENAGAIKLSSVHTFNPQNNSWNTPVTTGVIPILYDASIGTIDHDGKMYFWDGI
ncbi:2562_t:CDS:1, partial [Rhizophagus irregularis]